MNTLHLMGEVKKIVGKDTVKASISDITELFDYLNQYDAKMRKLLLSGLWAIGYGKDRDNITFLTYDTSQAHFDDDDIWLIPQVHGAELTVLAAFAIAFAVALVMAVISYMLMPSMAMMDEDDDEPGSNSPSIYFNGAANIQQPGSTLPLVYGDCRTGSVVIATAIETEDYVPATWENDDDK